MQASGKPLSRMKKLREGMSACSDVGRTMMIFQEREVALDSESPEILSVLELPSNQLVTGLNFLRVEAKFETEGNLEEIPVEL